MYIVYAYGIFLVKYISPGETVADGFTSDLTLLYDRVFSKYGPRVLIFG